MSMQAAADRTAAIGPVRSGLRTEAWIQWSVAIAVVFLVMAPLVPILIQAMVDRPLYEPGAVATLRNVVNLCTDPAFGGAIANSLMFAALGTAFAQVLGAAFAILIGRTDLPGKAILSGIIIAPLYLSQLLLATGWLIMFGPAGYVTSALKLYGVPVWWDLYSIPGMAIAAAVCQIPITFLYCQSALRSADASLEDAARVAGLAPWRVFARITLPLLTPALTISGILNLVMLLEALSVPLVLGRPANIEFLTSFIYTRGLSVSNPDYGLVASSAIILVTVVIVLTSMQRILLRKPARFVTLGGKQTRPKRFELRQWRWPALVLTMVYVIGLVLLPIGGLIAYGFAKFLTPLIPIWDVLTLDNYRQVLATDVYRRAIGNSILIAIFGGAIASALVALLALVVHRSRFPFARALDTIAFLPRAVPGMIAGIGIFYVTVLLPPLGWLRETLVLIAIAFTMRYIPLGYGAVASATIAIDDQLDRSARVAGMPWWGTMRRIILPILRPAILSAYAIMFIHFFKDYSTAVFLAAPGSEILGTTMLQMFVSGETGPAAALATVQIVITVLVILVARRLAGVSLHG